MVSLNSYDTVITAFNINSVPIIYQTESRSGGDI